MDRSQRDNDRKEREREGERTESIRERGKMVGNGFSQWDGGKREGKRGRATRYNKEDTGKVEEELGGGGAESKGREEEVRETAMDGA
ncbi:hypothetical protein EYF80_014129 [Liparis tanakae]|uniref:Uncharacterized protein n=1 Tax=Liparis tanakae TaxID=230148 RepID=A0A4Z2ICU7_9TELE|nr:hypothetical protein EYF80_014129 [Liparis tanakae]